MRRFLFLLKPSELLFVCCQAISHSPALGGALSPVVCSVLLLNVVFAQENLEKLPKGQQTGMSTGAAHAAVKDAQSRPITAGGFVQGAPAVFRDISHAAGIDKFHHKSGTAEKRDRKSTRLNSSHRCISYAVFCLKKKTN